MIASVLDLLVRLLLACTLALLVLLALRVPLRRQCGARVAYQAWLLLPLTLLLALLPPLAAVQQPGLARLPVIQFANAAGSASAAAGDGRALVMQTVLLVWGAGALGAAAWIVRGHRRFLRSLGPLRQEGPLWVASGAAHGPLLLGLRRGRIVVPSDFRQRYSARQQELIIAHETVHAERGDAWVNILLALLQCGFWFHPLVHAAAGRCRFDQELACDAIVIERHPGARRDYAQALLHTHSAGASPLAPCHWQSSHPLKERIMTMQHPPHRAGRRLAGRLALAALASLTAWGALAARADAPAAAPADPAAPIYQLEITMQAGGAAAATQRLRAVTPAQFRVRSDEPGKAWTGDFTVRGAGADTVMVGAYLTADGKPLAKPNLLLRLGEKGKVQVGSSDGATTYALELTVTRVDTLVPGA